MKDVIIRNIERLLLLDADDNEQERIEPMSEWKWNKLYQIVSKYQLGPWIADGLKAYENDFFLQMSPTLRQMFLDLRGEKDEELLERFLLQVERSQGTLHHLTKRSLAAYANELIKNIKNIEE
jgi:hypothetical protein